MAMNTQLLNSKLMPSLVLMDYAAVIGLRFNRFFNIQMGQADRKSKLANQVYLLGKNGTVHLAD